MPFAAVFFAHRFCFIHIPQKFPKSFLRGRMYGTLMILMKPSPQKNKMLFDLALLHICLFCFLLAVQRLGLDICGLYRIVPNA